MALAFEKGSSLIQKAVEAKKKKEEEKKKDQEKRTESAMELLSDILDTAPQSKEEEVPEAKPAVTVERRAPVNVPPKVEPVAIRAKKASQSGGSTSLYLPPGGERKTMEVPEDHLDYTETILKAFKRQGIKIRNRELIPLCAYLIQDMDPKKLIQTFGKMMSEVEEKQN